MKGIRTWQVLLEYFCCQLVCLCDGSVKINSNADLFVRKPSENWSTKKIPQESISSIPYSTGQSSIIPSVFLSCSAKKNSWGNASCGLLFPRGPIELHKIAGPKREFIQIKAKKVLNGSLFKSMQRRGQAIQVLWNIGTHRKNLYVFSYCIFLTCTFYCVSHKQNTKRQKDPLLHPCIILGRKYMSKMGELHWIQSLNRFSAVEFIPSIFLNREWIPRSESSVVSGVLQKMTFDKSEMLSRIYSIVRRSICRISC